MNRKPPPRLRTFAYRGLYRYFLTFCTAQRQELFRNAPLVHEVTAQLRTCSCRFDFAVLAYCFMPDHAHLLLEGTTDDSDLRKLVRIWKQQSAFAVKRRFCVELWQRGYYEHVLRDEEASKRVARYILENPVRAGLVACPEEYGYLGSFVTSVDDLLLRAHDRSS